MEEELVLAVRAGPSPGRPAVDPGGELERVPLVMFKDGYDLREATIEACRRAGFAPVLAMSGLEMDGALALAAAGVAAAVVPESVVPPGGPLRAVRFRGGALRRTIGLASRRDRPLSPAAQAFVSALQSQVSSDQDPAGSIVRQLGTDGMRAGRPLTKQPQQVRGDGGKRLSGAQGADPVDGAAVPDARTAGRSGVIAHVGVGVPAPFALIRISGGKGDGGVAEYLNVRWGGRIEVVNIGGDHIGYL